ncbi:MAG: VCBS repeat-containing protein, partial [Anaerolineae bacterium]|nr:VCBS repeat-containing protein [Anaerolineae bacterium]
ALGFEPKRYVDLPIVGEQLSAADLDSDGTAELVVRAENGTVSVYWGGAAGLDPGRVSRLRVESDLPLSDEALLAAAEYVPEPDLLVPVLRLNHTPHILVTRRDAVHLVPVTLGRGFGPPLTLACPAVWSAAVGDVDGDGYADLVFACRQSRGEGEVSWVYWGGADGYSDMRRTAFPTWRACDVAVADLDGDGCAEIAVCQSHTAESFTSESLVVRVGREGVRGEPVRLATEDARRVFVAHASDPATPQVVFVNYFARNLIGNIRPSIYFGGPDGFSPERRQDVPGWGAVEAICTDLNDDGFIDLVLANAAENAIHLDPGSYVLLNGPDGFPATPTWTLPTTRAHGVCCADLNRDGYLDLVFCGFRNPELLVFYGTADGFDTAHPQRIHLEYEGVVYAEPRWITLADLDNDGWLDLVVPQIDADRSLILWGGPQGFSLDRCQALSVVRGACARAADLTGNGYLDLIIGGHMPDPTGPHDSFLYIYWNGPDGLREDRRAVLPAKTVNAISVADFNNDGGLDIFICSYHGGQERDIDSYIYWNRPGQGFSAADRSRLFTHSASGCVAADFNEDGWVDLAIAYHKVNGDHVGHSAIWWNGPDGFVEGRVTRLPTSGPHGMTAVGIGNIADRGPEEYYTSRPWRLPEGNRVTGIAWQAELAPRTWVKAQLRAASTEAGLTDAPWFGPAGPGSWFEAGQAVEVYPEVRGWVQYRLALGAFNSGGTPRVTQIDLVYESPRRG